MNPSTQTQAEMFARLQAVMPSGRVSYFTIHDQIRQFMAAGDHNLGVLTKQPELAEVRRLWAHVCEEVMDEMQPLMLKIIDNKGIASLEQKAELLDHVVDSVYVLISVAIGFGLPFDHAFALVHDANMAKVLPNGPKKRADGKILKPEGWKPPDIFGLVLYCYEQLTIQDEHQKRKNGARESTELSVEPQKLEPLDLTPPNDPPLPVSENPPDSGHP